MLVSTRTRITTLWFDRKVSAMVGDAVARQVFHALEGAIYIRMIGNYCKGTKYPPYEGPSSMGLEYAQLWRAGRITNHMLGRRLC